MGTVIADLPTDPQPARDVPAAPTREVNSRELMQGQREIVIRHGDEAYRLSVTRSGKLILRK
jgi:hemin uptake protein HemP